LLDDAPQHLIRDRDRIYATIVTRRLRAMGIRDKPTASASPWQNGFAEPSEIAANNWLEGQTSLP
jgi:hypothetical protein